MGIIVSLCTNASAEEQVWDTFRRICPALRYLIQATRPSMPILQPRSRAWRCCTDAVGHWLTESSTIRATAYMPIAFTLRSSKAPPLALRLVRRTQVHGVQLCLHREEEEE